jgi:hypothetical protein
VTSPGEWPGATRPGGRVDPGQLSCVRSCSLCVIAQLRYCNSFAFISRLS